MTRSRLVFLVVTLVLATSSPAAAQDPRVWTSAEYLLWWAKDSPAPPPLLSTGTLGAPDFSVVLGGRDAELGARQGARFTLGYRLTPDWSIEGIGFFLPSTSATRTVASSGAPGSVRLVIPAFRVEQGQEGRLTIANAGDFSGDARESLRSDMHGVEVNVARRVAGAGAWRVDALGGVRYLRLRESLGFAADSVALDVPDVFRVADTFETTNRFVGAQVGVGAEYARDRWFARATAKVALGVMRESVDVAGTFVTNDFTDFTAAQTFVGGAFAQPTNIGEHRRDRFAVVPEAGLKVGYRLTSWASVFVGYSFLYASATVRPGNQVDRNVNTTQAFAFQPPQTPAPTLTLQGQARPTPQFRESDFWVQGLDAGLSLSF